MARSLVGLLVAASCAVLSASGAATPYVLSKRAISQDVYDDLLWYWQYADSTAISNCAKPNGNVLITEFVSNPLIDSEGFIARDDNRKEIVISFRGSTTIQNYISDVELVLIPYDIANVTAPFGTLVHTGFLTAYKAVATELLANVTAVATEYPDYAIVPLGHSLGGAIASIAAVSLKASFPDRPMRLYTYGQPRTGNAVYATWVNDNFADNSFRVVHRDDCVPQLIVEAIGYQHHGTEYWQLTDPSSPGNFVHCAAGGEDPTCQDSVPLTSLNCTDHVTYMGIPTDTPFCT
ncbi:alpha/beta-hydrolase [Punctularia strigosozonata HHB-11173 SS5]|uniref:alpha/beta-hydrolase n=1 Tax=Punctularia strigosozonata (strain HHB-11173) TaxID=741275 RepID=UPI00044163FC|nr:alpha/beta-hydrolase [Punctularia strigosozonata HHB-11173 SS5]EIN12299.1 alpha/beta-hydrolase [Punctularia strigosozonata HHB-11173 SS5]